jgi:hypothetical protein
MSANHPHRSLSAWSAIAETAAARGFSLSVRSVASIAAFSALGIVPCMKAPAHNKNWQSIGAVTRRLVDTLLPSRCVEDAHVGTSSDDELHGPARAIPLGKPGREKAARDPIA